jgi:hypothetical protein
VRIIDLEKGNEKVVPYTSSEEDLAFYREGLYWISNTEIARSGKGILLVTSGQVTKTENYRGTGKLGQSPDGQKSVYMDGPHGSNNGEIFVYDHKSQKAEPISDTLGGYWEAEWSPR